MNKLLFVITLAVAIVAFGHFAKANTHNIEFVEALSDRAYAISGADLSREEKYRQFEELLKENFDIPRIARFSLGRFSRKFTPEQMKKFISLFEELIIVGYATMFYSYADYELVVLKEQITSNGKYVMVISKVVDRNKSVTLVWQIRTSNGQQKVVDITVEGVSMAITNRTEYVSILTNNNANIEKLFTEMRKIIAKQRKQ